MKIINGYFLPEEENQYESYFKHYENYQEEQRNRALSYVKNFDLAVDIGANLGLWTKDLTNYFDKTICFEPNSFCIDYLKKNINLNKAIIYNCVIGDLKQTKKLFCPINSGNSSFINKTKIGYNPDGTKINGEFPKDTKTEIVKVKTLDSFGIKKIDFIKIDVQGFEPEVLRGGERTFKSNNCVVCIEDSQSYNSQVINLLMLWGYKIVDKVVKEIILTNN